MERKFIVGQGNAWYGMERHGMAWHGKALKVEARQGVTWNDKTWNGKEIDGMNTYVGLGLGGSLSPYLF
jgi:hypothetical protein